MNHEPDIDDAFDVDETPSDKQLSHDIDDALAKARPERYDVDDKEWMDEVVELVSGLLAERERDDVIRDAARRRVYRREAEATKKTNKILRHIAETGEMPLGWGEGDTWRKLFFDVLHLPLSIARHRVRFGVASAQDLEQWELESAREDDKRRTAQISARSGARLLAKWLREHTVSRVEDYTGADPSAGGGEVAA